MPPPRESLGPIDELCLEAIVRALQESWPILKNLTAAGLDLDPRCDFLQTVRVLTESGLVSCEGIREGEDGPEVIGAALTARGRARFNPPVRHDLP